MLFCAQKTLKSPQNNFVRETVSSWCSNFWCSSLLLLDVPEEPCLPGIRYCNNPHTRTPLQFLKGLVTPFGPVSHLLHKEFWGVMESKGQRASTYTVRSGMWPSIQRLDKCIKTDKWKALCQWCARTIDVSSMGESALKLHSKSEKHRQNSQI